MEVYAPRDPLEEYLAGKITLRKLRVMAENPSVVALVHRALGHRWDDQEYLLHDLTSRLRELVVITSNVNRAKDTPAADVEYIPRPETPGGESNTAAPEVNHEERANLLAVLARTSPTT